MEKRKSSDCLFEVFSSPGKGLGLKAARNLFPGEAVLTEPALAHILSTKERGHKCDFCLRDSSSLLKCSRCKFMHYCGVSCQKKDWLVHKQECQCLLKVQPKRPPDICLLASRFILKLSKMEPERRKGKLQQISEYHLAITQKDDIMDAKRKEMFFTFAFVLQQFVDEKAFLKLNFTPSHTFGLLYWLSCNCFSILSDEMLSVGIGAYYNASLVNHSCKSNCVAVFEASAISIRALTDVKKGDEITISYIESLQTTEERQNELVERYFFKCQCCLCEEDSGKEKQSINGYCQHQESKEPVPTKSDGLLCNGSLSNCPENYCVGKEQDNLKFALARCKENASSTNLDDLETSIQTALSFIPAKSILIAKCYETMFYGCIRLEKWKLAIKYGLLLLALYLVFMGEIDPMTGIHLYLLGKIHRNLGHLGDGFEYLQRAKQVLVITHGNHHRITTELEDLLAETAAEIIHTRNNRQI